MPSGPPCVSKENNKDRRQSNALMAVFISLKTFSFTISILFMNRFVSTSRNWDIIAAAAFD